MSRLGTVMALFPALVVLEALACAGWLVLAPGPLPALALVAVLYLVPVASFRLHGAVFPLRAGASHLVGARYAPWWGGHQIQLFYIALPGLEAALRLVPGLYSAWLRLWGARIGRAVHWTPRVEITDRSLLVVGDRVVFGHHATLYAHVIRPSRDNLLLYVAPITIGDGAFVGAHSVIGPGAEIRPGTSMPAGSHVYPRQVVE
jgi:hypothetical protein